MIVLALDTANDFGSIALTYGDETLEEASLHSPDGFSGILFDQTDRLLKRNAVTLPQVDIYAAGMGPGSFTGIRIGLSAVKALAVAAGKPCYGISNLAAMANFGSAATHAAILDARRGEIYGAVYGAHSSAEVVTAFPEWLASIPAETEEFLAFDFTPFEAALSSSRFAHGTRTTVPRALAASIAELSLAKFRAGEHGDPALLDANYVRRPDAELLWRDKT
jgi:tRNA threonylcarbamoyladenosine biosynthesis protein TsaB